MVTVIPYLNPSQRQFLLELEFYRLHYPQIYALMLAEMGAFDAPKNAVKTLGSPLDAAITDFTGLHFGANQSGVAYWTPGTTTIYGPPLRGQRPAFTIQPYNSNPYNLSPQEWAWYSPVLPNLTYTGRGSWTPPPAVCFPGKALNANYRPYYQQNPRHTPYDYTLVWPDPSAGGLASLANKIVSTVVKPVATSIAAATKDVVGDAVSGIQKIDTPAKVAGLAVQAVKSGVATAEDVAKAVTSGGVKAILAPQVAIDAVVKKVVTPDLMHAASTKSVTDIVHLAGQTSPTAMTSQALVPAPIKALAAQFAATHQAAIHGAGVALALAAATVAAAPGLVADVAQGVTNTAVNAAKTIANNSTVQTAVKKLVSSAGKDVIATIAGKVGTGPTAQAQTLQAAGSPASPAVTQAVAASQAADASKNTLVLPGLLAAVSLLR